MIRIRSLICALLALVVLPLVGEGQDKKPRLTIQEAVKMALERNPEMFIAQAEMDELKGKITEVRSGAFPQVSFQGYGLRLRDPSILNSSSFDKVPQEFRDALDPIPSNMFNFGVEVKQPVYTAGKVRTALRLAKESLEEKAAAREAVRQQLTFKVFQAFNTMLLVDANRQVIQETHRQRMKQLELARNRFKDGVATEIDVLRSEVNVANTEPELIRADNRVQLARARINNLIVVNLDSPTEIEGTLEYRPWNAGSLEDIQKRALELRPELAVARRQMQEARLTLSLANAENKLTVDMSAAYGYTVREPKNLFNTDFTTWNVSLNFKIPFFDSGRKSGLVSQAQSRLNAAEQRLAQLENDVHLEVQQAYDDMRSAEKAIAVAKLSVNQAERVLTMMQANYQYGVATTLDVVDSQTAVVEARNNDIYAKYDYEMSKARLRLASGGSILDGEVNP
jgi:HAE1 family hydrophobic/amphiphilic exporter-1